MLVHVSFFTHVHYADLGGMAIVALAAALVFVAWQKGRVR